MQEPPAGLAALKLSLLDLLDQRCEAAERACQALVATRAEMTAQLVQQLQSGLAAGQREGAAAALHQYEARLAALEAAAGEGAAAAARECRAAVAAMEARLAEVQKGQEEAMGRVNAALLAIARKVGELAAGRQ